MRLGAVNRADRDGDGPVLTVAVTGGIGAGKSTVAGMLAELGAVVIDSDALAREVVAPGTLGLAAVVRAFGPGVLAADGSLDRAALAGIVFADAAARRRLEEITHPLVREEFRRRRDALAAPRGSDAAVGAATDAVVGAAVDSAAGTVLVNDIPILRSKRAAAEFDLVVVVVADEKVRLNRLVGRGLSEADARARIAAQISDDERRALADVVIENNGDDVALGAQVRRLWEERLKPGAARSAHR